MVNIKELLKRAADYGVNMEETMARFLDDDDFYEDCLIAFASDPSMRDIAFALAKKDYVAASDSAHALKGVASNLGLTSLSMAVSELIDTLREQDYDELDKQYGNVMMEYNRTLTILG